MKTQKNLKISEETHKILKLYCERKGLKIYKFLENLINENCKDTSSSIKHRKDIYGE